MQKVRKEKKTNINIEKKINRTCSFVNEKKKTMYLLEKMANTETVTW